MLLYNKGTRPCPSASKTIMTLIQERLQAVQSHIKQAMTNRDSQHILNKTGEVTLLAVSKAQPAEKLREAFMAGQKQFGENYLQEALNKQTELTDLAIEWHFIGPIQSNKTQPIAQHFSWVHGVDRLKIAQRLNDARPPELPPLQICLQVNISGETSKSGANPDELVSLASAIQDMPHLQLRGLMTIPEPTDNQALQRERFQQMRTLLENLNKDWVLNKNPTPLDTLSMGMSNDYVLAIEEGANIVRVGSAIFGARPSKTINE
ncbi:MAG: putative enzyme [Pseudomonadota bacterium]